MNFIINKRNWRKVVFMLLATLPMQQLYAQHQAGRPIFIVPTMDGNDTCKTADEAGRKWFNVNRKSEADDAIQNKYQSSKLNEDGTSLLVLFKPARKTEQAKAGR